MTKATLLLEDGTVFTGRAAGKTGTTTGEICFNTGMTGYQEIFTDPSYSGQILVATNVHIGNYGIKNEEVESESIKIAGFVCRNFNIPYSRVLADKTIQDYFEQENLVAIADVDTRALVQHIRMSGAMNSIISSETDDVEELKKRLRPLQPWIFHGFDKNAATARMLLQAGCYLSFGAALFRHNSHAADAFRQTPSDRFFLETDDSDLSIQQVYARAAEVRGITAAEVEHQVWANFQAVFG